jgi:hypothetical protein
MPPKQQQTSKKAVEKAKQKIVEVKKKQVFLENKYKMI